MDSIELVTDRLRLRPVIADDAGPTSALMRREIAANLTTWEPRTTLAAARERIEASARFLEERKAVNLAVLDRPSSELIGWLSIFVQDDRQHTARMGFWLGCEYQGQGLIVEAAKQAMPAGLDFLGARELEACVYPWNRYCIRAMAKLQFERNGATEIFSPVRNQTEMALIFRRGFASSVGASANGTRSSTDRQLPIDM